MEIDDNSSENSNASAVAFYFFYEDHFPETQRNNPTLDNQSLHRVLCRNFANLPSQEKQIYFARAAAEMYMSHTEKDKNATKKSQSSDSNFLKSNTVMTRQSSQKNVQLMENSNSGSQNSAASLSTGSSQNTQINSDLDNTVDEILKQAPRKPIPPPTTASTAGGLSRSTTGENSFASKADFVENESNYVLLTPFYPPSITPHQLLTDIELKVNLSSSISSFDSNCLLNYPLTFVRK